MFTATPCELLAIVIYLNCTLRALIYMVKWLIPWTCFVNHSQIGQTHVQSNTVSCLQNQLLMILHKMVLLVQRIIFEQFTNFALLLGRTILHLRLIVLMQTIIFVLLLLILNTKLCIITHCKYIAAQMVYINNVGHILR